MELGLSADIEFFLGLSPSTSLVATVIAVFVIISATVAGALLGFLVGTLKVPDISKFEFTKKTGGENIDDIIKRAIKFKTRGKKIYLYN